MPVPNPALFGRHRKGNAAGGGGDGPRKGLTPPKAANDNPAPFRLLLLRAVLLAATALILAWTLLR